MTYVVTEACIKCKFMDCVEVCPVDCFYEGENMLVISPDECIDCGVCEPECPPEAIKADTESGLEKWLSVNADYAKVWPNIAQKGEAPADANTVTRIASSGFGHLRSTRRYSIAEVKQIKSMDSRTTAAKPKCWFKKPKETSQSHSQAYQGSPAWVYENMSCWGTWP